MGDAEGPGANDSLFVGLCLLAAGAYRYACQIGVSPDMKYVISGDGDGRLWLWDWKSTKVARTLNPKP